MVGRWHAFLDQALFLLPANCADCYCGKLYSNLRLLTEKATSSPGYGGD
jgi:hypothetical protein